MVRKLKTYQTSVGFFDLAVAAPSMKAALEIWGADSNLFHQGFATETQDPDVVAATAAHPGIVLRRPVGTDGAFKETAELPTGLASGKAAPLLTTRCPSRAPAPARKSTTRKPEKPAGFLLPALGGLPFPLLLGVVGAEP